MLDLNTIKRLVLFKKISHRTWPVSEYFVPDTYDKSKDVFYGIKEFRVGSSLRTFYSINGANIEDWYYEDTGLAIYDPSIKDEDYRLLNELSNGIDQCLDNLRELKTAPTDVNQKKCNCDINTLMAFGCNCGGK